MAGRLALLSVLVALFGTLGASSQLFFGSRAFQMASA